MKKETIKQGQKLLDEISNSELQRDEKLSGLGYSLGDVNKTYFAFLDNYLKSNSQPMIDLKEELNSARELFISSMKDAIKNAYQKQIDAFEKEIEELK